MGDHSRAFDALGSALAQDPRQPRTILAAGSIIQVGAKGGGGERGKQVRDGTGQL
jgi:hypothetical protein